MANKLREINNDLLFNAKNEEEIKKQKIIMNILKDDLCFIKMDIDDAYSILEDLKLNDEEIEETYTSIMSDILKKIS